MTESHAPPAFACKRQHPRPPFRHAEPLQEVGDGLRALALLEPQAAQLTTDPFVEAVQVALAVGVAEVGHLRAEWSDHIEHDLVTPYRDSEGSERLLTLL